jgi:putative ABC transport system permease protein
MDIRPILSTLHRHKITSLLLILQIALTCAIVCNAVFLIHQRLQRMDIPSGVADHELLQIKFAYIGDRPDAYAQAQTDLATLRQIAGVQAVALVNQLPLSGYSMSNSGIKLHPQQQQTSLEVASYYGQNLLATLGLRLISGRDFQPDELVDLKTALPALHSDDMKNLPHTVIIDQAVATRLWPGQNALGKMIYFGNDIPMQVVGVSSPLARPDSLQMGAQNSIVFPIRLTATEGGSYVIRTTSGDREQVLKSALAALNRLDPNRIVLEQRTYDELRHDYFQDDRAMAGMLVGVIAALLIVTALGIVGLASFWVGAAPPHHRRAPRAGGHPRQHPALLPDREFRAGHDRYRAWHGADSKARVSATTRSWNFGSRTSAEPSIGWPPRRNRRRSDRMHRSGSW